MNSRISPEIELVFEQLRWVERRRYRIVESVSAHFGRALVAKVLEAHQAPISPLAGEPTLIKILDHRGPESFLRDLALKMETTEAAAITILRSHVSVYREHVDEQILFGARTAGQEAARAFLSRTRTQPSHGPLSVPEAVQAVFELNYVGLPGEKNYFLMLRPQGSCSVHFARSPHLPAWKQAGADLRFLYQVRREWVRGILDILSPGVELAAPMAIEQGQPYGLEHFFHRGEHAGP